MYIIVYMYIRGRFWELAQEERLLLMLKQRKRGALERAIDTYTPYVSVVIYNTAGASLAKEDIEEVVSDVFIALWKNAETLDFSKGSLRAYLASAARNTAKNKLRTVKASEELNENIVSLSQEPSENAEEQERRKLLLSLIKELGEPDSEIFLRYYWYEEKISYISAVTGVKAATVKTKLSRGREKLKKMLCKRRYGDEEI